MQAFTRTHVRECHVQGSLVRAAIRARPSATRPSRAPYMYSTTPLARRSPLSTANVVLHASGHAKLVDFGLALAMDGPLATEDTSGASTAGTLAMAYVGTAPYMVCAKDGLVTLCFLRCGVVISGGFALPLVIKPLVFV
jgi:hypothetical protein